MANESNAYVEALPHSAPVRLTCSNPSCWIGTIEITSKGGLVRRGPSCPHCQGKLTADDTWPGAEPEFSTLEAIESGPALHIHFHSMPVDLTGKSTATAFLEMAGTYLKRRGHSRL
jgi:hypothetical protein